jgi:hypothetical protein
MANPCTQDCSEYGAVVCVCDNCGTIQPLSVKSVPCPICNTPLMTREEGLTKCIKEREKAKKDRGESLEGINK